MKGKEWCNGKACLAVFEFIVHCSGIMCYSSFIWDKVVKKNFKIKVNVGYINFDIANINFTWILINISLQIWSKIHLSWYSQYQHW